MSAATIGAVIFKYLRIKGKEGDDELVLMVVFVLVFIRGALDWYNLIAFN